MSRHKGTVRFVVLDDVVIVDVVGIVVVAVVGEAGPSFEP